MYSDCTALHSIAQWRFCGAFFSQFHSFLFDFYFVICCRLFISLGCNDMIMACSTTTFSTLHRYIIFFFFFSPSILLLRFFHFTICFCPIVVVWSTGSLCANTHSRAHITKSIQFKHIHALIRVFNKILRVLGLLSCFSSSQFTLFCIHCLKKTDINQILKENPACTQRSSMFNCSHRHLDGITIPKHRTNW